MFFSNPSGADLKDAHFETTRIDKSVFEGADLRGADLSGTVGLPASLRGAMYDRQTRLPKRIVPGSGT